MILWCAYCQKFQGEAEPFDDYRISHGICRACRVGFDRGDDLELRGLDPIRRLYASLEEIALSGDRGELPALLDTSARLGIEPIDLLMGLVQPLLARIGDLWAENRVTVSIEHRFSSLVGELLADFRRKHAPGAPPPAPELVLVNVEDNYHTLGLQMAEAYFTMHGVPTLAVVPGLPAREVLDLLAEHRPRAVGISVALPEQMGPLREIAERLSRLPRVPERILVGGSAVRRGSRPEAAIGFHACRQVPEALELLR